MYFLSDIASFSTLKDYVTGEIKNPNSVTLVNSPGFSPINSLKNNAKKTVTLAGIGTAKYVKDKKLNRRQRRQVEKWQQVFSPPKPKAPKPFFNPFRKKPVVPTNTTQPVLPVK